MNVAVVKNVALSLQDAYRDFDHFNRFDPLDELLFIICSTKTNENNYRAAFSRLRQLFPTRKDLLASRQEDIASAIKVGGLSAQKSKAIREILTIIHEKFGSLSLSPLRHMSDMEVEEFLISLPTVGTKVARCVMLYSLEREVFPVDTHCWRVARRLGWIRPTIRDGRCTVRDMNRLQGKIPSPLRHSLHVNFVSHGRAVCTVVAPNCSECVIHVYCKRIGVKARSIDAPVRVEAQPLSRNHGRRLV